MIAAKKAPKTKAPAPAKPSKAPKAGKGVPAPIAAPSAVPSADPTKAPIAASTAPVLLLCVLSRALRAL